MKFTTKLTLSICGQLLTLLFLCSLPEAPAWSQASNGTIEGTVTDPSGAAVPNATLKATSEATGLGFNETSDSNGLFRFSALPVGTYTIEVEHPGFAKLTQKNVILSVGARLNLSLTMQVATQEAAVTVTAEAPLVETTRSQVSTTVNDLSVANLPVNGRNFINFVLLTPGVTTDVRLGDISFAGQRGTLNSLIVDGADDNNTFFGQTTGRIGSGRAPYQFSQDAVQEFQVNSNAYTAELGHAGGAVINVITKSGTNQFHGTGFEFYRDTSLNANDLINKNRAKSKSPLHFNQFGGDIGGPIVHDRAFFFFDYDGQRNTLPNFTFLQLPRGFKPSTPAQQAALTYLTARATPWARTQNENVYLGKVDWRISNAELLTGRINSQRFTGNNFENGGNQNAAEHTGASDVTTDTFGISLTSTIDPALVNVARFQYRRDNEPGFANSINPEANVLQSGTVFVVGRNFFSPRFTNIRGGEGNDTLSFTQGRHTFKGGVNFLYDRIDNFFPGNFSGSYTFGSIEDFGDSLLGLPLGSPKSDSYTQAFAGIGTTGPTTKPNLSEASAFLEDEWRLRSNFTLNLGVRYDLDTVPQPHTLNPSPALQAAGLRTNHINRDTNNVGPRLGFAWSPRGSTRLVVRGGYGIFYGRTPSIMTGTAFSNNGLNVATLTFNGASALFPQYPNTICGAPVASPSCAAPTGAAANTPTIFVFNRDYVEPYVQQGSFGTEWQFQNNMSVGVTYLWVKGVHLQRSRDINLAGPEIPTPIPIVSPPGTVVQTLTFNKLRQCGSGPCRPIAGFSRIEEFESNANSLYNGLTLQLNKRYARNFQFLASYSYGKVIDNVPDATSVVPFSFGDDAKMASDPLNLRADRAVGNNDQTHRFVLSGIWDLRYAGGLPRFGRAILGGWELSAIYTAQSGQPFSPILSFDLNGDSNKATDRTPGTGRNTFRLPATYELDPRITKNINLNERVKFQLIAEAFNIFNRANIAGVNNTQFSVGTKASACGTGITLCLLPNSSFLAPTNTLGPRIAQLAAKFTF